MAEITQVGKETNNKKTDDLFLHWSLREIKAIKDESIHPGKMYGFLEWYSIATSLSLAFVLMMPAPAPTIALISKRSRWKTRKRKRGAIFHKAAFSLSSSHYRMPPHNRFAYSHAAPPATKD